MADEGSGTPQERVNELLASFEEQLLAAVYALQEFEGTLEGMGGGVGGGAGGGPGGGGTGRIGTAAARPPAVSDMSLLATIRANPATAAAIGLTAMAAPTFTAGLTSESRGGDPWAGISASVNQRLASGLPFGLGETLGLTPAVRQFNDTIAGTLSSFEAITRYTDPADVPIETRNFMLGWHKEMAGHQESWRQWAQEATKMSFDQKPPALGSWITSAEVQSAMENYARYAPGSWPLYAAASLFR